MMASANPKATQRQAAVPEPDDFVPRRVGWFRWEVVCVSSADGVRWECCFGQRFWTRMAAQRVAAGLRSAVMTALWSANAHPQQHGSVPVAPVGGFCGRRGTQTARGA